MKLKKSDHYFTDGSFYYRFFIDVDNNLWLGYEEWIYPTYNTHDRCYGINNKKIGFEIDDNIKFYNI